MSASLKSEKVVILAGGMGTRVASLTGGRVPKVLLDVAGRPFIDRKIDELLADGAEHLVILAGHGADMLREHVAAAAHPLRVDVVEDGPTLRGTAGAVRAALSQLADEFWLTYGDTFLTVDVRGAETAFDLAEADGLMTVLHNRDRWQPSNTSVEHGYVTAYAKGEPAGTHEWIDYGMLLLRRRVFERLAPDLVGDLSLVFADLARRHQLLPFEASEVFRDIGTPEALWETAATFRSRET